MVMNGYEYADVTVLQQPKHGTLSKDLSPQNAITYYPNPGYIGNDKVVFLVNIDGHKIKVIHTIKVRDLKDFNTNPFSGTRYCPAHGWWKISSNSPQFPLDGNKALNVFFNSSFDIDGLVVLNRNFGSGYKYPLLIEDASIVPKK